MLTTLAVPSGAGAPARGGRSGTASPTTMKGAAGSAATGVASMARQPCDPKGGGGFIGVRAFGSSLFRGESFLIVDATPVDAKVFLDGALLGVAGQLMARAFPLAAGKHAIEIVAPGFRPYLAVFVTDVYGFSTRIRVSLVAERPRPLGSP